MSTASAPARFTFDRDLGQPEDRSRVISDDKLDDIARQAGDDGYARGLSAGEATAAAQSAKALAAAAGQLADRIVELNRTFDATQEQTLKDAVLLAASVGRKLAGTLIAREPVGEIEALLDECLSSLRQCPHVVIRCHPDLADAVRDTADERLKTAGFSGRLVVMGEPDIELGDARIEWAEGGITRDIDAIGKQVETHVNAYLASRDPIEDESTSQPEGISNE